MSLLREIARLRLGTPSDTKPMGPQMLTTEVTRNIIISRLTALRRFDSSISPRKWAVSDLCCSSAAANPAATSASEKTMSSGVNTRRGIS